MLVQDGSTPLRAKESEVVSENIQRVQDFIAAWVEADLEKVMALVADDCFYHNIPMAPLEGEAAIRTFIQGFIGMAKEIDWVVHHIAEGADGSVLTERTDRFLIGEKWLEIRVMGTFELKEGKISAWRDYFDLGQMQAQMPGGGG
jgi:limonene-1,2-epoxide hydrolase